jgi:predicted metal-binding membrane protein
LPKRHGALSAIAEMGFESMLRRDGAVVLAALVLLSLLAWLAVLAGAGTGMDPAAISGWWLPSAAAPAFGSRWTPAYWLIAFFMWASMMVAMMLPSASPMVRQAEKRGDNRGASASIAAFAGGYLALWILFSLVAVALQWMLERAGGLSVLMNSRSMFMSGALLIAAGLYQLTPLKSHASSSAGRQLPSWPRIGAAACLALGAWDLSMAFTASAAVPYSCCSSSSEAS